MFAWFPQSRAIGKFGEETLAGAYVFSLIRFSASKRDTSSTTAQANIMPHYLSAVLTQEYSHSLLLLLLLPR